VYRKKTGEFTNIVVVFLWIKKVCLDLVSSVITVILLAVQITHIPISQNLHQSTMAKDDLTLPCIILNKLKLVSVPDAPDVYQK